MTTLRRALGFRDLTLYYIVTTFSIRWIATAAAAGPSALVIWVMAALLLFVPLVFTVLELSSRIVTYAIWLPSGDQTGEVFGAASWVIAVPFPVATS